MLKGLNHMTLAVSDIEQSLAFYMKNLGFTGHVKWNTGAYLSLGSLWLCLSLDTPDKKDDYTHIALDIEAGDFEEKARFLRNQKVKEWKVNVSEGASLYILDPDGHKLEIHSGSLDNRLDSLKSHPYEGLTWL